MKKIYLIIALASTSVFGVTSCSKDETTKAVTDIRDQVIGTFDFKVKYYTADGQGNLTPSGKADYSGTFIVTKTDNNTFTAKEGGNVIVVGSKLAAGNNGFVFDVQEQVISGSTMTGYNAATLGGIKYNGLYLNDVKELSFGYQTTVNSVVNVFIFTANKVQ
ncbi:MAG: hypothetical protein V4538_02310 [Bacteroidota bacterium]